MQFHLANIAFIFAIFLTPGPAGVLSLKMGEQRAFKRFLPIAALLSISLVPIIAFSSAASSVLANIEIENDGTIHWINFALSIYILWLLYSPTFFNAIDDSDSKIELLAISTNLFNPKSWLLIPPLLIAKPPATASGDVFTGVLVVCIVALVAFATNSAWYTIGASLQSNQSKSSHLKHLISILTIVYLNWALMHHVFSLDT